MGETLCLFLVVLIHPSTFSILKRIVMGETKPSGDWLAGGQNFFQYPQADRDG